jgi:hypothetical protein
MFTRNWRWPHSWQTKMTKEQFAIPEGPLWEYIGDLSQDVLECSYNQADIRSMWVNGRLDYWVLRTLKEYHWRLERWKREDSLYSDQLTAMVVQFGGWSPHWGWVVPTEWTVEDWDPEGPPKPEVSPLTDKEQAIVAAFLEKYDIVVKE